MSSNALYTDLSGYYDLMCVDIDYQAQSHCVQRLHQLFGNAGKQHLDLACGTGPHVRHFIDAGFHSSGLDLNQPMLDIASERCPEAHFICQDMSELTVAEPLDLITCFLYSIHYNANLDKLKQCFAKVHESLASGGTFCFNVVDKYQINNNSFVRHSATQDDALFTFASRWYYAGEGDHQALKLSIERTDAGETQFWSDEHPMVAFGIEEVSSLLEPYFEVNAFEHDYDKLIPWDRRSGNALLACIKR